MAERIIPMRSTERSNETIRHIWLKSSSERTRRQSDFHTIRVGIAAGSDVDWLGSWVQSSYGITANDKFNISGDFALNIYLSPGDEIVVGISETGTPVSLDGMSVEIKGGRVGAVGPQNVKRLDGDFPPGAEVTTPLFASSANIEDGPTRDALNSIIDTLNESGVLDWSHSHALTDV